MPLPDPTADRSPLHCRAVTCRGFRRADGLWDIEGHMTDVKDYAFDNKARGRIEPGTPLHEMWLRLTLTDGFEITWVAAVTEAGPFAGCAAITGNYQALKGLVIGPGFRKKALAAVGGTAGCTHHTELLWSVATAAFQTMAPILSREKKARGEATTAPGQRPFLLNSCHIYDEAGPVAAELWPDWAKTP